MDATLSGAVAHRAGLAAEAQVAADYARRGMATAALRWRGCAGEIDLVARSGAEVIFVEVKKSRSFAAAAARVSPRQIRRLLAAAGEFLDGEPLGSLTPMRFDVALVDVHGRIEVLENALGP